MDSTKIDGTSKFNLHFRQQTADSRQQTKTRERPSEQLEDPKSSKLRCRNYRASKTACIRLLRTPSWRRIVIFTKCDHAQGHNTQSIARYLPAGEPLGSGEHRESATACQCRRRATAYRPRDLESCKSPLSFSHSPPPRGSRVMWEGDDTRCHYHYYAGGLLQEAQSMNE